MPTALSDEQLDALIARFDTLVAKSLRRAIKSGTSEALTAAGVPGPDQVDTTTGEPHMSGMIALVPNDPSSFALAGGEAADSLHVTLAYLGDTEDIPDHVLELFDTWMGRLAETQGPIEGEIFGASIWNVDSDAPSLNASIGGERVSFIHDFIWRLLFFIDEDYEWEPPMNHSPWVAHMCLAYGDAETLKTKLPDALMLNGPIVFDRIRIALGGESTDYALRWPNESVE